MRAKASAVAPAKPATTRPPARVRTFLALPLTMVWPMETWPSPAITVDPPLRTARMVVPCQWGNEETSDWLCIIGHVAGRGRWVKAHELQRRRGGTLCPPSGAARDRRAGAA